MHIIIAFNSLDFSTPSLTEQAVSMQPGLLKRHFTHRLKGFASICLTEIDQAFIVWGALTLFIFSLGQFSTMSWTTQTILDAALTGAGVAITSGLTWAIASSAKLRWVIFLWVGLMSVGTTVTAYSIFYGSALILSNLCVLWLGLCAVGYGAMAIGMQSRCFTAACWVHLAALPALSHNSSCQFFISGLVMALTLFFFSVVPWDMQASNDSK